MKAALAAKLEQLLTENVYVKEKVGMLEGIIQDLTSELANKKQEGKLMQAELDALSGIMPGGGVNSPTALAPAAVNGSPVSPVDARVHRVSTVADAIDEI